MNPNILPDYLSFLNKQIIKQEALLICHHKAEAQLEMLRLGNLNRLSTLMLHHYLWTLSDIIQEASRLNESLLNDLLRLAALWEPSSRKPV